MGLVAEGLDYAIRFGDGALQGAEAERILRAPLSPVCTPALSDRWFRGAGLKHAPVRGPMFDSSTVTRSSGRSRSKSMWMATG
jgi:LysR family transcriptional regulator, regulator of gene expression of beta-lactamase